MRGLRVQIGFSGTFPFLQVQARREKQKWYPEAASESTRFRRKPVCSQWFSGSPGPRSRGKMDGVGCARRQARIRDGGIAERHGRGGGHFFRETQHRNQPGRKTAERNHRKAVPDRCDAVCDRQQFERRERNDRIGRHGLRARARHHQMGCIPEEHILSGFYHGPQQPQFPLRARERVFADGHEQRAIGFAPQPIHRFAGENREFEPMPVDCGRCAGNNAQYAFDGFPRHRDIPVPPHRAAGGNEVRDARGVRERARCRALACGNAIERDGPRRTNREAMSAPDATAVGMRPGYGMSIFELQQPRDAIRNAKPAARAAG